MINHASIPPRRPMPPVTGRAAASSRGHAAVTGQTARDADAAIVFRPGASRRKQPAKDEYR